MCVGGKEDGLKKEKRKEGGREGVKEESFIRIYNFYWAFTFL